jgi:hypothetical protein
MAPREKELQLQATFRHFHRTLRGLNPTVVLESGNYESYESYESCESYESYERDIDTTFLSEEPIKLMEMITCHIQDSTASSGDFSLYFGESGDDVSITFSFTRDAAGNVIRVHAKSSYQSIDAEQDYDGRWHGSVHQEQRANPKRVHVGDQTIHVGKIKKMLMIIANALR